MPVVKINKAGAANSDNNELKPPVKKNLLKKTRSKKKAPSGKNRIVAKKPVAAVKKKAGSSRGKRLNRESAKPTAKKTGRKIVAKKLPPIKKVKQKIKLAHHEGGDRAELIDINIREGGKKKKMNSADDSVKKNIVAAHEIEAGQKENEVDLLRSKGERVKKVVTSSLRSEESRHKEELLGAKIRTRRSIKLYRQIAFSFIFLTLALLAAIFYFSLVKATIILVPNQERISNNMVIDIYNNDSGEKAGASAIKGVVKSVAIEYKDVYRASGEKVIGEEVSGTVKIINNYSKNQPLVATTRLLSPDGRLFRIKKTVNVPAGGSVEVEIYADKPGEDMAIAGVERFTIPGLWAGLQDKIYAQNKGDIIYKQKVKKHIVQEDIDNAVRNLKKGLLAKAKVEINKTYRDYSQIIYKIDENSIETEVKGRVGDEKDEFSASMKAQIAVVAFDGKLAAGLAKQKFISSLSKNKEMISFDAKNIIYSLNNYDAQARVAAVNAAFEGRVSLKEDSKIVDVNKILGLKERQLDAYLDNLPEIAGYEVKFFPSFIRRVPKLVDRVEIIIKK